MGVVYSLEDIENALSHLTKQLQNEAVDEVLEASSIPIIQAMENNVPVDTEELKGTLGEIKKDGSGASRKIHLGSTSEDRKVVERAYYQEHGNSSMAGTKWMKKSFQNSKSEALSIIQDKLLEGIFNR